MTAPRISIVIGYKDWGMSRLVGAVRSIRSSLADVPAEIVVSDYGSTDSSGYAEALESEGAVYVRTETDGIWSRSRALNAGLQRANGDILATTDADMVFSPGTFGAIVERLQRDPQQYVVMQCNDLPEGIDHEDIESGRYDWDQLTRLSRLRPRWGMGGMIAFSSNAYRDVRGLDERMVIYGGEDIDLARRLQRVGLKLTWLDPASGRMFHVWHPSSRSSASQTKEGIDAIALNREIHLHDRTTSRNLTEWRFAPPTRDPLVSVVISTHNRADHLGYAIQSVLAQSMSDFELLVVDDGSSDDTRAVVASFRDSRVRYEYRDQAGIASARNFATDIARGRYIAVMDDDDLMTPTRLEDSLNAVTEGANGSYGGWVDFVDETGALTLRPGKRLSHDSIIFNGGILAHATLLIERRWLQAVRYDETLRSGSDYNLAVRLVRSGVRLNHCGRYVLMRRLHAGQVTATDSPIQKASGAVTGFWGRATMVGSDVEPARRDREARDKIATPTLEEVEQAVAELLPDSVVERSVVITESGGRAFNGRIDDVPSRRRTRSIARATGSELLLAEHEIEDVTLEELLRLRQTFGSAVAVRTRYRSNGRTVDGGRPTGAPSRADAREIIGEDALDRALEVESAAAGLSCVLVRWPVGVDAAAGPALVRQRGTAFEYIVEESGKREIVSALLTQASEDDCRRIADEFTAAVGGSRACVISPVGGF